MLGVSRCFNIVLMMVYQSVMRAKFDCFFSFTVMSFLNNPEGNVNLVLRISILRGLGIRPLCERVTSLTCSH